MAKMKVHELAKELAINSKDVMSLLTEKGVEIKSHMSILEDAEIEQVKRKYGASSTPQASESPDKASAVSAPKNDDIPMKKKKNIIIVGNPQNSKSPKPSRPEQKAPSYSQNAGQSEAPARPNGIIKPRITPSDYTKDMQPEQTIKQEAKQETKPETKQEERQSQVATNHAQGEAAAPVIPQETSAPKATPEAAAQPQQTARPYNSNNNANRSYSDRPQRPQGTGSNYNNRPYGDRPQRPQDGTGSNYNNRPYGDRPQRPQDGTGSYNNRPYGDRPQRPQDGTSSYNNRPYGDRPQRPQDGTSSYNNRPYGDRPQRPQDGTSSYNNRPYGDRPQRPQDGTSNYNNRPYGDRPQRPQDGTSSYNNRPYGDRPQRPQNGTSSYNNRPYGDRPQRPQDGTSSYNNRPYGDRPQRPQDGSSSYGNRPYGDRAQRPQDGRTGGFGGAGAKDARSDTRYPSKPGSRVMPTVSAKDAEKRRDEEKRKIAQEKAKRNKKTFSFEEDADKVVATKNKAGRFIKPEKRANEALEEQIKVITLPEKLTIRELADAMRIQPSAIVKKLFLQGQVVTVNQEIDYQKAEEIAIEYEIICEHEVVVDVIEELLKEDDEAQDEMTTRPPVVCVMGHVDHGKTSLLDAIRKTNVIDREAGGITQHIGAYCVNINGRSITFLDTPGHEAFTSMRMRGANATDIAILVVAADDGVMPQTIEAINHAKAAGIEIIVAINKIDKPSANIERVKQELTEYELVSEDWGGSTVFAPVSAKSGEGIEQLLEMILLTADIMELKANANRKARGLVIEAELDKGRGSVATILVQKGILHVGDFISAGATYGKVRAMIDDKGKNVREAGPSTPVEILGLSNVPNAGEIFISHENDKDAKTFAETFIAHNKEKLLDDTKAKMSLDDLFSQIQAGNLKELNLILKADVQGSVEAVKQSLLKLSNEEVVVKVIHSGVGAINESDVILASASKAIIIGFNVRPDATAKSTAEREGVDLRLYKVIYQAIEDVEAAMRGMLDPIFEEKVLGHAEIRQIFKASSIGNIAGAFVLDGIFQRGCKVRVSRQGEQVFEGPLSSLKRFKDDVKEVKAGFECGFVFDGYDSMQELDIVEAYTMVEVPRK